MLADSQKSPAKMEKFTVEVKIGNTWQKANKENLEQLVDTLNKSPTLTEARKNNRGLVVPLQSGNIQYKVTPAATEKTKAVFQNAMQQTVSPQRPLPPQRPPLSPKLLPQRPDAEFLDGVKKGYSSVVDELRTSKAPVAKKSLQDALKIAASQNNKEMTTALIKLIESRENMGSVVELFMRDCIKNKNMSAFACVVKSCKPTKDTPLSKMMREALTNILLDAFKAKNVSLVKEIMSFGVQPNDVVYWMAQKQPSEEVGNAIKSHFKVKDKI